MNLARASAASSTRASDPPREQDRRWSWPYLSPGVIVVLVAALVTIVPLLPRGIPSTADGPLHLMRLVEFDAILRSGVLYPRWAPDLAYGYGYPLFNYYAPLFYYVAEVPHLLGAGFELALKLTIFGTFALYAVGMYWWIRPILGVAPAAVAAVAYLFFPFRFHEAYMQGDYPQFLAFGIAPLAFGALYRLYVARSFAAGPFAVVSVAVGAIVLTHNISAIWIAPTLAAYALALLVGLAVRARKEPDARHRDHAAPEAGRGSWRRDGLARLASGMAAGLLALGLTAFFWLPALVEQNLVQIYRLRTDDFDVRHSFLDLPTLLAPPRVVDQTAANPPPYLHLGWGQTALALATLALLALLLRRRNDREARLDPILIVHLGFGWVLFLASALMTLPVSTPIWRRVPLLLFTEYPWRVLQVSGLALALLAGIAAYLALRLLPQRGDGPNHRAATAVVGAAMLALVVPSLVYLYPHRPFTAYADLGPATVTAFERAGGAVGTTSAGEYYPMGVTTRPTASLPANPAGVGRLDRTSLPPGARAAFLGADGYRERYAVDLPAPTTARFDLIRFAGWELLVDGKAVPTGASPGQGLLLASLPAGSHVVELNFVDTSIRRLGWLVALLAAVAGIAALLGPALARRAAGARRPMRERAPRGLFDSGEDDDGIRAPSLPLSASGGTILSLGFAVLLVLRLSNLPPYAVIFARESPADRVVGAQHPLTVNLENKVELLGYDLDQDVAHPGSPLRLTLYWKALQPLSADYRSLAMVARVGDAGLLTQDDRVHPGGIPTRAWRPDQYTIDTHTIDIPPNATPLVYQIQVALYDPATGEHLRQVGISGSGANQVVLQRIHVSAGAAVDLDGYRTVDGSPVFGGGIAFLGYRVDHERPRPGQTIQVTLLWRAQEPIGHDYTVFVHLVDANQRQIAGQDNPPVHGQYPTSAWLRGETIVDTYQLTLPADAPAGPSHLAIGCYDPATTKRLDAIGKGWSAPRNQLDLDLPIVVER